jgi:hypothetical protein
MEGPKQTVLTGSGKGASRPRYILRRLGLAAGIVAAGLTAGLVLGQVIQTEMTTATYCVFSYSGPPINCGVMKYNLLAGSRYVCVPCPPESFPCNTGGAANYVNKMCPGANTEAYMFTNASPYCGKCAAPPS